MFQQIMMMKNHAHRRRQPIPYYCNERLCRRAIMCVMRCRGSGCGGNPFAMYMCLEGQPADVQAIGGRYYPIGTTGPTIPHTTHKRTPPPVDGEADRGGASRFARGAEALFVPYGFFLHSHLTQRQRQSVPTIPSAPGEPTT
jgi:hypothetical protein